MENFAGDLKYALRMLIKTPGFTAVAVIVLALGIGANTAIFSAVNAVLLSRLPYKDPSRLVFVWHAYPELKLDQASLSPPSYVEYRDMPRCFQSFGVMTDWSANLTGIGAPERVQGARVSYDFLSTLGVEPEAGRIFLPDEDKPGSDGEVLVSHALAARKFGSAAAAVGKTLLLNDRTYSVVGVAPASFAFYGNYDVLKPMAFETKELTPDNHGNEFLVGVARLRDGVTFQQAQAEMHSVADSLRPQFYNFPGSQWNIALTRLPDELLGQMRIALLILLSAVVLVLLIACSNVASLLLARATAREKEIAVRSALGASRTRVIRQLLTESVLLAVTGGAIGAGLAFVGVRLLVRMVPQDLAQFIYGWNKVGVDGKVLLFTVAVSVLTGVIFGIAPALQASKVNLSDSLKEGGRSGAGGGHRNRLRSVLVVAEVALALVLLISAGLLIKSFGKLQQTPAGLDSSNILTFRVALPESRYKEDPKISNFFLRSLDRISHLPGVRCASVASNLPMAQNHWNASFRVEDFQPGPGGVFPHGDPNRISPDYFRVMSIPLLQGRFFTDADGKDSLPVTIIDDTLAEQYWPGENPIGKRISANFEGSDGKRVWRQIVGVVAHVKDYGLDGITKNQYYMPQTQNAGSEMSFVIKTSGDPMSVAREAEDAIHSVDSDEPVYQVQAMQTVYDSSIAVKRFAMFLLGVFSAVAMILAIVGIYGVMAYVVAQRTHEIGIRLAIGASARDVVTLMMRNGVVLSGLGIAIGLAGSFAATRALSSFLFNVTPTDPLTFTMVSGLLVAATVFATLIPAARATRVDPVEALRYG
jgi:predicted permease